MRWRRGQRVVHVVAGRAAHNGEEGVPFRWRLLRQHVHHSGEECGTEALAGEAWLAGISWRVGSAVWAVATPHGAWPALVLSPGGLEVELVATRTGWCSADIRADSLMVHSATFELPPVP